jgi:hypothetical protein
MATGADFPPDLKGFGYGFNEAGQMRQLEEDGETLSDRPFQFEVTEGAAVLSNALLQVKPGDRGYNQAHYEALGEVVTEEVYRLLEVRGGLQRRELRAGKGDGGAQCRLCLVPAARCSRPPELRLRVARV